MAPAWRLLHTMAPVPHRHSKGGVAPPISNSEGPTAYGPTGAGIKLLAPCHMAYWAWVGRLGMGSSACCG